MAPSESGDNNTESPTSDSSSQSGSTPGADTPFAPLAAGYHTRLDVPINAPKKVVRKEGKKAANTFHPDKQTEDFDEEIYVRISTARETLQDSGERDDYQLFCLNFGVVDGTEKYETWKQQGKPQSASEVVTRELKGTPHEYIPLSELESHTPIPRERDPPQQEPSESDADTNTPETTDRDVSEDSTDSNGDDPLEQTTHTGSGAGLTDQMDIILSEYTPTIVRYSGDRREIGLEMLPGKYNVLSISGWAQHDLHFNISDGGLTNEFDEPVDVTWDDLPSPGHHRFKTDDMELVIDLLGEGDADVGPNTHHDRGGSSTGATAPKHQETTTPPKDSADTSASGLQISPMNILLKTVAGVVWVGVALSPFLTTLASAGWVALLLPLKRTGFWISTLFTTYLILPLGFVGLPHPTGNVPLPFVLVGVIISAGLSFSTIRKGLLGRR